jgi:hypothetical protein
MVVFACVLIYILILVLILPDSDFTIKSVLLNVIWPIVLIWLLFKGTIAAINELFSWLMWLFGIKYRSTTIYRKIDNWAIK